MNNYFHALIPETPHKYLSPNYKVNEGGYRRVFGVAKTFAERHHISMEGRWPLRDTTVTWLVFWGKGHKIMDRDNLIKTLKPYQDGLAKLVGVNDKLFIPEVHQYRDPAGKGFMIVLMTALE